MRVSEILNLTGGKLVQGDEEAIFSQIASLNEATAGDISFLGNEKYLNDYMESQAGCVFVSEKVEPCNAEAVLVEVENPSFAFGQIVNAFTESANQWTPGIHPSSIIAEDVILDESLVQVMAHTAIAKGVTVGKGSSIGNGVSVGENVTIGENCKIYPNVTIREGCVLGDRVIIQPGAVIGSDGFGYEFVDGKHVKVEQVGIVVIEDDVEIGANTTIDRARFGKTVIGEGSKIDNLVQIAHNAKIGKHSVIVSQSGIAGSSEIGNYVTMAAQSGMAGHIKIGDKAILMARAGVTKNLEGGQVYKGFPARPVRAENRRLAVVSRLPKLIKEFKELQNQIEELKQL